MKYFVIFTMFVLSITAASAQKPIEYFKKGITPPYPLTGSTEVTLSDDNHFSYTSTDGTTYSFHCSHTDNDVDCTEGSGVYTDLYLTDGSSIYIGGKYIDDPWGLVDIDGAFKDPLRNKSGNTVFHLRWKEFDARFGTGVLCVQAPGTESIPDGKERKKYSATHHMEYCYFAVKNEKSLGTAFPDATTHEIVTNSEASKSSPAAAAALAEVGHVQTSEEMAELVHEGKASKFSVITSPPGAEIDIDGNKAGVSPMVFVLLKKGDTPRVITVKLSGYRTVEKGVVPDGTTIPILLILERDVQ